MTSVEIGQVTVLLIVWFALYCGTLKGRSTVRIWLYFLRGIIGRK